MLVLQPLNLLSKFRKILFAVSMNSIKSKYAGSALGIIWAVVYPLLFLSIYAAVFIGILKIRLDQFSGFDYILLIFCGLIPWFGFSESLASGTSCVITNSNLIKNTLFPIELIPVQTVIVSSVTQIIGLIMLVLILGVKGMLGAASIFVVYAFVLQLLFTIGLTWILASVAVFIRDIIQIIPVVILMLMMISPIGYTEDMIPEGMRVFMKFNPLYFMVALYREPLMFDRLPSVNNIIIFSVVSVFMFYFGFWVFSRLKEVFSDYV